MQVIFDSKPQAGLSRGCVRSLGAICLSKDPDAVQTPGTCVRGC
jgi:hypothetical protein